MEAQRFEAFTIHDAIKLIRKELGKDAVIVSTKEVEKKVPGHSKNQKIVEVYAAPSAQKIQKHTFPTMAYPNPATVVKSTPPLSKSPPSGPKAPPSPRPSHESQINMPCVQGELSAIHSDIKKLQVALQGLPEVRVGDQLEELKLLVKELYREQGTAHIPAHYLDVFAVLKAASIDEKIITKIMNHLSSQEMNKGKTAIDPLEKSIEFLYKNLKINNWVDSTNQKIIALVGPSGVGKTTVTAKLTAYFKQKEKKVSVISYDECRLLPSEPLKVLSKILEIPYFETTDLDELTKLIRKRTDDDYIFIDTASRSMSKAHEVNEIKALLQVPFPLELALVLPAGIRQKDLDSTIRSYKTPFLKSILFTKIDEFWPFGEMVNCSLKYGLGLSYFSNGNRVPEDLIPASKDFVLEKLFKI